MTESVWKMNLPKCLGQKFRGENPVTPGKNLALVCEVIGKNHLSKILGYHPAKLFNQELLKVMRQRPKVDPFITEDLNND